MGDLTKTLYLVGLGLGDAKDITVRGLEIVKQVGKVYLENYTSILCCGQQELEQLYGRSIVLVDRDMMETGCEEILDSAQVGGAAVLVVGDPLNATTHTDLLLRAASRKIPYKIIHNASILNSVACCGLQIYNFGETVSIPFWTDTWKPESFYDKIMRNRANNLHTLCLLDIKIKEPNLELMIKGITKMDPPRFMSISQAAEQLVAIMRNRQSKSNDHHQDNAKVGLGNISSSEAPSDELTTSSTTTTTYDTCLNENSTCIGLARVGSSTQQIVKTTFIEAINIDLGPPLHSLVIPGDMHPIEEEMIDLFSR